MGEINESINAEKVNFGLLREMIYQQLLSLTPLKELFATDKALKENSLDTLHAIWKKAGLTPITMFGSPGVGKTTIINQAIEEINRNINQAIDEGKYVHNNGEEDVTVTIDTEKHPTLIDRLKYRKKIRNYNPVTNRWEEADDTIETRIQFGQQIYTLASMDRTEFELIPLMNISTGQIEYKVPDIIPTEEKDGKYGVVFFDEVTSADTALMQPYMSASDGRRMLGTTKLPENWLVLAAGNAGFSNSQDGVGGFSQACMTRGMVLDTFIGEADLPFFFSGIDDKTGKPYFHQTVKAFLSLLPQYVAQADNEDIEEKTKDALKANPRTWTIVSAYLQELETVNENWVDELLDHELNKNGERIYSKIINVVGSEVGQKYILFLSANQNQSLKYDIEKIQLGTERKCDFGALKQTGSADIGGGTAQVHINEYQAVLAMLTEGLIASFTNRYKKFDEICKANNHSISHLLQNGIKRVFTPDMDEATIKESPIYQGYTDIISRYVNTLDWLLECDASVEVAIQFFGQSQKSMPANVRQDILTGLSKYNPLIRNDDREKETASKLVKVNQFVMSATTLFNDASSLEELAATVAAQLTL